MFMGFSKCKIN